MGPSRWGELGGGAEAKLKPLQNMVMLHIYLKLKTCSNMVANILPTDTLLPQVVGSKGQTIYFVKVVKLHIKLKGIEHSSP